MSQALKYCHLATHPQTGEKHNKAMTPVNRCHRCGATSYKPVIKRDDSGIMKPSGEYQCVGCKFLFTDIDVWKHGGVANPGSHDESRRPA